MSNNIDQNVVEMRFDNSNFEKNVKTSMSSLDKLKQKLNLSGASKGLEELDKAAKGITFATATRGAEELQMKISALGVVGVTAISNITNSVIGMTKTMFDAVTGISAIKGGFEEYQTQLGAIQTIMANTSSKGTTLDQVNSALDELNHYADKTIYNFTQMTRNIGTFTAAGVDLNTAVDSIKGIANLAAASGSSSLQASTAMYQLSQAIAAGKVQLMDWNSVVNAGMGGELFQNALKRTAEHFGTDVDGMIKKYGSFRESLTEGGWLTVDVLTETLKQISGAYTEADLISQGYTEDQAKAISELATTAENAATKVKTFAELWDTISEAAGSGWTTTWSLIFGDFEYARENLTWFSDYFSKAVNNMSDARNNLLQPALDSNWDRLITKITEAGISSADFSTKVKERLRENGEDVDALMVEYGTLENLFKSGKVSTDVLKQAVDDLGASYENLADVTGIFQHGAGFDSEQGNEDVKKIQRQLKALGYDLGQFGEQADGVDGQLGDMTEAAIRAFQEAHGLEVDGIIGPQTLAALQESVDTSSDLRTEIDGLIDGVDELGGRDRIFQSLKNIIQAVAKVAGAAKTAFENIFPPVTSENIYNAIVKFEEFTEGLIISDETSEKLSRAFSGLFAVVKIFANLIGGPLRVALRIADGLCSLFGTSLLDVAAGVGDAVVAFSDWFNAFGQLPSVVDGVNSFVQGVIDTFNNLATFFTSGFQGDFSACFQPLVDGVNALEDGIWVALKDTPVGAFVDWISGIVNSLKDLATDTIGDNFVQGILNGIQNGIGKLAEWASAIAHTLLDTVKNILGIHSPSVEGEYIGENFIQGIINGISNFASNLWEIVKGVGQGILDTIKGFDLGAVIPILIGGGLIAAFAFIGGKLSKGVKNVTGPFGDLAEAVESISESLKTDKMVKQANAFKTFAEALVILSAAILGLAYGISQDAGAVWGAVGVITALAVVVGAISIAMGKLGGKGIDTVGVSALLVGLASVLGVMAGVVYMLGRMDTGQLAQGVIATAALSVLVIGLVALIKRLDSLDKFGSAKGNFGTLLGIGIAIGALALVVKSLGSMSTDELERGVICAAALGLIIAAIVKASRSFTNAKGVGASLLGVAVVFGTMAVLVLAFSKMDPSDFDNGYQCVIKLALVVGALLLVNGLASRISGRNKAAGGLFGVAAVLVVMAVIVKAFSSMDSSDFDKGLYCVEALSTLVAALLIVSAIAGKLSKGAGVGSLLAIAVVIGVMSGICILLGYLDASKVQNGVKAIGEISGILALLMLCSAAAKKVKAGPLIAISVSIGLLAAAIAVLSYMDPTGVETAVDAMTQIMAVFAIIEYASQFAKGSLGTLIVITVAIGLIAAAIAVLANITDAESALASAGSITLVMLAMAAVLAVCGGIKQVDSSAIAALGAIIVAVALIAVILAAMSQLDVAPSIETALSISVMLVAMAAVVKILSTIGPMAGGAIAAAGSFDAVVAIIGGLLVGLGALVTYFPQAEEFLDTGIDILVKIGNGIGEALGAIVGGFLEGATMNLDQVGKNLFDFMTNLQPFLTFASSIPDNIIEKMGLLSGAILAVCGDEIVSAITDFFTGGNGGNSIIQKFEDLGTGISKFAESLDGVDTTTLSAGSQAASLIAELINAIPTEGGLAGLIFGDKDISGFFSNLEGYGTGLAAFASSCEGITFSNGQQIADLATTISTINDSIPTEGGLIAGIIGGKNYDQFGTRITSFGDGLADFATSISGIEEIQNGSAIESILEILGKMDDIIGTEGGIISAFTGNVNYSGFETNAQNFAEGLNSFATECAEFPSLSDTSKTNIENCAEALSKMNNTIPKSGGVISFIAGESNLGEFGNRAASFGEGLSSFAKSCTDFPEDINFDAVQECVNFLSDMGEVVGKEGGVWGEVTKFFTGSTNFDNFKTNSQKYGEAINGFAGALNGFPEINYAAVRTCTECLAEMGSILTSSEQAGATMPWENDKFENLGNNGAKFAEGLQKFAENCADIPSTGLNNARQACGLLDEVVKSEWINKGDTLETFGAKLASFGGKLGDFQSGSSSFDTTRFQTIVETLKSLKELNVDGFSLDGIDFSGLTSSLSTAFENDDSTNDRMQSMGSTLGASLIAGFEVGSKDLNNKVIGILSESINTIAGSAHLFSDQGTNMVKSMADAVNASPALTSAVATISWAAASEAMSHYWDFYSAGESMISGLLGGLNSLADEVERKAANIANKAAEAVRTAAQIHSPARKWIPLGEFMGKGLAVGINKSSLEVTRSSENLATVAEGSVLDVFNALDSFDTNLDSEPIIRPVLDLSDVQNGAKYIDNMFGYSNAVKLNSAIEQSLNVSTNDDVISAISNLGDDIRNMPRNTYSVGDVTYDDGSTTARAVSDLTRAVKIWRRS